MKKIIYLLLCIVFSSSLLIGCKSNKEAGDEVIIKEFVTKMYTLEDYKTVDMAKVNLEYPKDQYTNEIRKISTESAFEGFILDRIKYIYIDHLSAVHINSKVASISIDQQSSENDGSIVYNYKAKLKLTFTETKVEKEEEVGGQLTLNKVKNNWVITRFNKVELIKK
ncbi:MAG: hypothetical protein ACREV6_18995 [Clostridium sp.]|uniref:hypothetical protein n=1 Tax=Clostridium sp. TaxID=1506 RepID=UPI003D6D9808